MFSNFFFSENCALYEIMSKTFGGTRGHTNDAKV